MTDQEEIAELDSAIARIERVMQNGSLSEPKRQDLAAVLKTLRDMRAAIVRASKERPQ